MVEGVNRQWTLASRPDGYPAADNFRLVESPIVSAGPGELLVQTIWMSLDPYMRGRMSAARSYTAPVDIGGVMMGEVVGRVVESRSDGFSRGDVVAAPLGWQEYGVVQADRARKVDPSVAPTSTALGVLGMPGLTAYFGLLDVCEAAPGDVVVVSAASGAVGAVVGQIAKLMGCRVVGTAGTEEKVAYVVDELGFDAGINYKGEDVGHALSAACPDGVDVYFDNVGGPVTDAVMERLRYRARVAICGQISQYNLAEPALGPRNLRYLLTNQARMEGFLVFNYTARYEEARARLTQWVQDGRIKYREDVVEGFENAPRAFMGMMHGANFGKLLVKVAEE